MTQLAEFAETHPGLLPANVALTRVLVAPARGRAADRGHEHSVARQLAADTDYVALCHWNANVDNAWFWREAATSGLHCGLMDWGCVGQMNLGMALWGAMSGAETDLWDRHLDELLQRVRHRSRAGVAVRISTRTDCAGTPCCMRRRWVWPGCWTYRR